MVDIENELLEIISGKLSQVYPNVLVLGTTNLNPSEFPCVYIEEADNYSLRSSRDSRSTDNHDVIVYEVNVFSNRSVNKKGECKAILSVIDDIFNSFGFTRMNKNPFSFDDSTKYRLFARYTAVVSRDKIIYRR